MWGLTVEEASAPPTEVWADVMPSVDVFIAMTTQWRVGAAGPVGLDYAALPEVWRRLKVPPGERDRVFDDLRLMEAEALTVMGERREDA